MLVYPQLSTGASGPYPLVKQSTQRTAVNSIPDGSTVVYADPDAAQVGWELEYKALNAEEWASIESLFEAVSGQYLTFTFLDPSGNLLTQSEVFSAPEWSNDPAIALTAGIADPLGTTRATQISNGGGATQAVKQTLAVPGNFQYCLSVWARSPGSSSATLMISTAGGSVEQTFALTTNWSRIAIAGNPGQTTDSVTFEVQLQPAASVDLFGMQADAQPGASDYKMTGTQGGVYSKARFAADRIDVTAQGTDVFDATVRILDTEG